jgi:hypothetical protein
MQNKRSSAEKRDVVKPLALGYAERRPMVERKGH